MHTLTCERQADRVKDRSASPARARSDSRDRRRRRSDSRDYDRRRRSDSRDDDRRRSRRDDRDRSRCAGFFLLRSKTVVPLPAQCWRACSHTPR